MNNAYVILYLFTDEILLKEFLVKYVNQPLTIKYQKNGVM